MELEEYFDKKVEDNFDIKSKRISILQNYGENFQEVEYITNPAIGRDRQIKELILILLNSFFYILCKISSSDKSLLYSDLESYIIGQSAPNPVVSTLKYFRKV